MSVETNNQRTRKGQSYPGAPGLGQNVSPRDSNTPSPSFQERQRAVRGQPIPHVYAHQQQPSPTASNSSHQSRRSPPPSNPNNSNPNTNPNPNARVSPPNARDFTYDRPVPPPPPIHSISNPDVRPPLPLPLPPQHAFSQPDLHAGIPPNPSLGFPRPVTRVPPPQFLTQFQQLESKWQMTDELMAEIERADLQQATAGTMGVAYAGGISSGPISTSTVQVHAGSPPKDYNMERVRTTMERSSPKDWDSGGSTGRRQGRERERELQATRSSPKARDRPSQQQQHAPSGISIQAKNRGHSSPDSNESPSYHTPTGSPPEQPATFGPYEQQREYYPAPVQQQLTGTSEGRRMAANPSVPDVMGSRVTPPAIAKLSGQTPPAQASKTRTPDRSLPVQEEAEEEVAAVAASNSRWSAPATNGYARQDVEAVDVGRQHQASRPPSPDRRSEGARYDLTDDNSGRTSRAAHRDDEETLIDHADDGASVQQNGDYAHAHDRRFVQTSNMEYQHTLRSKPRNGATDQLGLRGLEQTFETMKDEHPMMQHIAQQEYQRRYLSPANSNANTNYSDMQFFEDPTSAYIQAYLQSTARPGAPIPPTPRSNTAAPSPLISAVHSEAGPSPAPPVGSPYPYPFTHIRRTYNYNQAPQNPSSAHDPNSPAAIKAQLARQMQMYALNNAAIMSDSTLSPSSTPYPGPGYNPWTFLPTTRANGLLNADPTFSLRSSPSHEPLDLPLPPHRARSLKKRNKASGLRNSVTAKKERKQPPPRVESTQPRETSPDDATSSGEETAGEDNVEERRVGDEAEWADAVEAAEEEEDEGDWADEDEEGDEDDLLELEFHPTYVTNVEKRRRKWETRWDELVQTFQALDRQTDTTMVLLAAPSHTKKLHAVTSRSIRRDPSLHHSPSVSSLRSSFNQIAASRRVSRTQLVQSLVDKLSLPSSSSADGSDVSSSSREEELRRALEAALGSLGALGNIYEQREARWREEMRRLSDDRERVELLLRQALGAGLPNGTNGMGQAL